MKNGYRYLPWRLKLIWVLTSVAVFFVLNYLIASKVRNNDMFIYSEQTLEIQQNSDSIVRMQLRIDSLDTDYNTKRNSLGRLELTIDSLAKARAFSEKELRKIKDSIVSRRKIKAN
ncbi:hypothetical protein [Parachryseolinea silvisoli]|uniref:hypothetical protein n=1 Tax=Parachryseolinea silvisoli TaxID=2873601 RepID=UPI002265E8AC|nr:hypothetical protein [Parachryseolinea silvisoli]MCD9019149.1 hypothetical protein [Parachryseolinea silvisoli]